jgi:uncharacterized RDD family membrane protein YckC
VARFIDAVVLLVLVSLVLLPVHFSYWHQFSIAFHDMLNNVHRNAGQQGAIPGQSLPAVPTGRLLVASLISVVIAFAYDWLQHGLWGQTVGKRAMGTIVVTAGTWAKISGQAACARAAVYALPSPVPYAGLLFSGLDQMWLLWDRQRQCVHDKAGRTIVVKKTALRALTAAGGSQIPVPPTWNFTGSPSQPPAQPRGF